ncbi:DUF3696 domain-containing protein [Vibrio cholerae]|uniref:DUF3696 domain-containing protein n=1 Tax=Vibrio tarriae TaxID=2014742 RepID=UPI000DE49421|nr:DUF3696 domain-containing protein [Vibrio tarriae]RBM27868.1 DUF3696 domain-containing protein [Vibrio tarriae]
MLDSIYIENFKCFKKQLIPMANLTLLTGFNAAGKSSSIQTLLLGAQIQKSAEGEYSASLNGSLVKLGTVGDVRCHYGAGKEICITYSSGDDYLKLSLDASSRKENSLPFKSKWTGHNKNSIYSKLHKLIYISAIRNGTLDVYPVPKDSFPVHADVGDCGQYAPWWLEKHSDDVVCSQRLNKSEPATSLRAQLNAWANELFPGAEATVEQLENLPLVKLSMRTSKQQQYKRPANIGYGLTYAFPILVAGLLAKREQILIVDSPEAHLHPQGQSKMGYFLGVMASAGVQVVCETHSDHVLNGVRLAVADKAIPNSDVAIHFFQSQFDKNEEAPLITSPQLDSNGSLDMWPEGFFDQTDKDLARLNGWV